MRFLLINPYYSISETPSPPLGIAYLAAALEDAGFEVKVLDFVVYPYDRAFLADMLADFNPAIVGATSVTMTFDHAIGIIRDVKKINHDIVTIMGGPHVSFCAEDTLTAYPELDMVVLGEGEKTVVELSRAIQKGEGLETIPGLVYRNKSDIINNGFRPDPVDVNTLPVPARHLIPLGRYRALGMAISMTSSRGCPFKCIFCVGRKMVGAKVRYRDPVKVVDEIEYLSTLNFSQINMADDLFTANARHCIGVCDEILRRKLQVKWTSFARVDTVSREVLSKMREAGCHTVSFGIETANADILKTIQKGITIPQIYEAINLCNDAGIMPHASFILGLPGETPETLEETVSFGEKLKSMGVYHGFHLLAPFPGTAVREQCSEYGIKILTDNWAEYHANRAIVETSTVTKSMMDERVIAWEDEYNGKLDDIKQRMKRGEATEEEAWPLINLERTILVYELMMAGGIEKRGSWTLTSGTPSETELLSALASRVWDLTPYTEQETVEALKQNLDQGNLTYRLTGDTVRWEWVDYL